MQKIYSHSERSNLINQEWRVVVYYVQQDRMWSSLSSIWQVLCTCYGYSSWNYSSPRPKTSPLNHLTYHCLLSILGDNGWVICILLGPRWPGHFFCQFEKRFPQPKLACLFGGKNTYIFASIISNTLLNCHLHTGTTNGWTQNIKSVYVNRKSV